MTKADDLREQAERCRRLAKSTTDPNVARILTGLADEYMVRARGLERRTLPTVPGPAPEQPMQQQQQIQPKREERDEKE